MQVHLLSCELMCGTFDDESVWSSHCSRKDLVNLTKFREVTSDSMSNCPRSFIPVDAFVSSSAKVFNSVKVFFTGIVLVRVQQCLK